MLERLVEVWRAKGVVHDERVFEAFLAVDRKRFVMDEWREFAYVDTALPLVAGQSISQPTTVAIMLDELDVKEGMRVLEVGAGSGYVAALLSFLVGESGEVFAIEVLPEVARLCEHNVVEPNVRVVLGDGREGLPDKAPFDRIIVSAGGDRVPSELIEQLAEGGVLVMPVGDESGQVMVRMTRDGDCVQVRRRIGSFRFVPLV